MTPDQPLPAIRPLDISPLPESNGVPHFALRDSTRIAAQMLAVSLPGYFVLAHLDGRRSAREIQARFAEQFGATIPLDDIAGLVGVLETHFMLQTPRYEAEFARRRDDYLAGDVRDNRDHWPPAAELAAEVGGLLASGAADIDFSLRGVVAPHLDYGRGGPCYADAYAALRRGRTARRYVILGTNHFGRARCPVATTRDFQTPLGRTATDADFIERLERALGGSLRIHEFDHAAEHSIELQVHLLQAQLGDRPFTIVPVLCPDPCGPSGTKPADGVGVDLGAFADALAACLDEDTQIIASADLSHVGQRFGDEQPTTPERLEQLETADRALLEHVAARRDEEFVAAVRATDNSTRICSVGCIYAALRALRGGERDAQRGAERDAQRGAERHPLRGGEHHLLRGGACRVLRYHQAANIAAETTVTCAAAAIA